LRGPSRAGPPIDELVARGESLRIDGHEAIGIAALRAVAPETCEIDLGATIETACAHVADVHLGEVRVHREGTLIGRADRARLAQLTRQLATTGLRAGGNVEVTLAVSEGRLQIVATMARLPLSSTERSAILDPAGVAALPESARGGLVLRLGVARQLAESMGGELRLQPSAEASIATVTLPIS
jgi:hypothetical protein